MSSEVDIAIDKLELALLHLEVIQSSPTQVFSLEVLSEESKIPMQTIILAQLLVNMLGLSHRNGLHLSEAVAALLRKGKV